MPELVPVTCPYCGESIELVVDSSAIPAHYVEDCQVCCRPMQVSVAGGGSELVVTVKTGDE